MATQKSLDTDEFSDRIIFCGGQIYFENQWLLAHAIVVEEKIIKAIIPAKMVSHHLPAKVYEFPPDFFLLPGFIDMHIHGTSGKDVMDEAVDSLHMISASLAREGVTGFLATTMSAEADKITRVLQAIAESFGEEPGARILGVHLEGPFIADGRKGAQRSMGLQPNINLFADWQMTAKHSIKVVTLAPELPGALDLIKYLRDQDIIVAIGHTDASYEETLTAIEFGATQATHLFNAMKGIHQREPGPTVALLLSDKIIAELIVDGHHLHPAMVDLAYRLKQKDRLLLVTDSMRAKCMAAGEYELGGQIVYMENGIARLADGTLAGSVLTMPIAIKNMVQCTNCSLLDAVYMASTKPAEQLKLSQKGEIAIGKDADLVILNGDFTVMLTMREGKQIFP